MSWAHDLWYPEVLNPRHYVRTRFEPGKKTAYSAALPLILAKAMKPLRLAVSLSYTARSSQNRFRAPSPKMSAGSS
jgi:hypothetical protein